MSRVDEIVTSPRCTIRDGREFCAKANRRLGNGVAIPATLYRKRSLDWGRQIWRSMGVGRSNSKDLLMLFDGVLSTENLLSIAAVELVTAYRDVVFLLIGHVSQWIAFGGFWGGADGTLGSSY